MSAPRGSGALEPALNRGATGSGMTTRKLDPRPRVLVTVMVPEQMADISGDRQP